MNRKSPTHHGYATSEDSNKMEMEPSLIVSLCSTHLESETQNPVDPLIVVESPRNMFAASRRSQLNRENVNDSFSNCLDIEEMLPQRFVFKPLLEKVDDDESTNEDDDDVIDTTPAPVIIDIADDFDD